MNANKSPHALSESQVVLPRSMISMGRVVANIALLGAIIVGLRLWPAPSVSASHWTQPLSHIKNVHNLDGDAAASSKEEYCVRTTGSSLDWATELSRIRNILIYENPTEDWDGTGNWKIDIWTETSAPCDQLSEARRNEVEIEYRIMDTVPVCGGTSCAVAAGPHFDSRSQHQEYYWYNIYLRTAAYNQSDFNRHWLVNHETGHAFGLSDGTCPMDTSIMHYQNGSCINKQWPTSQDRSSVANLTTHLGP